MTIARRLGDGIMRQIALVAQGDIERMPMGYESLVGDMDSRLCRILSFDDGRPKRSLGGLTPGQYAKQLAIRAVTMSNDSKAPCY